jgi:uncharacterized RDD family membrane protein YckC
MLCAICGEICRCSSEEDSNPLPRWLPDEDIPAAALDPATGREGKLAPAGPGSGALSATEADLSAGQQEVEEEGTSAWREELAARLNRYQSRRKPRPPRYPSLRLRFEEAPPFKSDRAPAEAASVPPVLPTAASHALAWERFEEAADASDIPPPFKLQPDDAGDVSTPPLATAKVLEFPRSWTPPVPARDELAESVMERPRILDVPEVVPPPPALGGIIIEPVQQPELEKRPGIDIPLRSAPLGRRLLSALIDGLIIASNCAVFSLIFWKVTALEPPTLQIAAVLTSLCVVLWAGYQYLLLVYTGSTPGLRLSGLKLVRFDGSVAGRKLRRWRVLASFLSAFSLGMGYAWVFLDEDSLCWHDRITHTYLEEKKQAG